jgi:predicted DNA-binding transcriptional regulator AlpA
MKFETVAQASTTLRARRAAGYSPEPLYSLKDVMERYQASSSTIRRWARTGILPSPIKMGSMLRWKLSELETFERKNKKREADNAEREEV